MADNDSSIPIFIYHESDQKPSKGLGKKQSYLKYILKQVESINSRVILFGDESNKEWAGEWYSATSYKSHKWRRFEESFVNLSDYPDEWAKGIFKRFFIVEEFCTQNEIHDLIILDSDVLVYINLSEYPFREKCKIALEWSQKADVTKQAQKAENVVCGIGYFTIDKLREYTDFCIRVYEDKEGEYYRILEDHFKSRQELGLHGGACEMTLLYLWLADCCGKDAINLLEPNGEICFLNDINGKENYVSEEFRINPATNTKVIRFKKGRPCVKRILDESWTEVSNIHFGGDSKRFIKDYYKYQRITVYDYIYYVAIMNYRKKIKPILKKAKKFNKQKG